jgi:polyphosphate:AMP phosphotransferase
VFESAELGHTVDKKTFEAESARLRAALLDMQHQIVEGAKFPVIVLINGMDGAGRGETIHVLNEWMDPRFILTHAFGIPTEEERERPFMWRFWRALPPKGRIGILFGSWYSELVHLMMGADGRSDEESADLRAAAINRFEKMLTDEGALVVKFWFHLSKSGQRKRLKELEADPQTRWRVGKEDWKRYREYDRFRAVAETILRNTSKANAPWYIVDGSDARFRALTVGQILLEAMQKRHERPDGSRRVAEAPIFHSTLDRRNLLSELDLTQTVGKDRYEKSLHAYQERLGQLMRSPAFASRSIVAVFEGNDAAGKGGAIRRVTQAVDARHFQVVPVAAPTEEERAQPYLWRFWRHLPRTGRLTIFDRSWYGRVLVERVEGFASEADWMRAYAEINDFEDQLVRHGVIVAKFWLAISPEEQLKRFKEREAIEHKRFKITDEDWRNRDKWDAYEVAVCDMVDRTSTEIAPWTLVEANDKRFARLKVLKTLVKRLEAALPGS